MNDIAQAIAIAVAGTWIGGVGVGIITVGLRLNNAVQKLTVVVDDLAEQVGRNRDDITHIKRGHGKHAERLAVLEYRKETP